MAFFKLEPCPFCGQSVAVFSTVCDCEICANFEQEDCPECYAPGENDDCIHFVVCNANEGGCGAATGWYRDAEEAAKAWNRRTV